ncbi:outer membrane beta-barrel protein [Flavobacterium pedocola]
MSERNNIDRLFQEKFKDFEVAPPERAWGNIQTKMSHKNKKFNFLPLFLIFSGFAAIFIISFSVSDTFHFNPFDFGNKSAIEKKNIETDANDAVVTTNAKTGEQSSAAATPKEALPSNTENASVEEMTGKEAATASKTATVSTTEKENTTTGTAAYKTSATSKIQNAALSNKKNSVASLSGRNQKTTEGEYAASDKTASGKKDFSMQTTAGKNTSVAITNADSNTATTKGKNANASETIAKNSVVTDDETDILYENNAESKIAYETRNNRPRTAVTKERNVREKSNVMAADTKTSAAKNPGGSGHDDLKHISSDMMGVVKDSAAITAGKVVKMASLEDEEEEKKAEKAKKENKWIVSSVASPIYMNVNGYGSVIDPKFNDNSKSYQTRMSYGVGLRYPINNKWTLRTGLNILNFEYNTNNIVYYDSANGSDLEFVTTNSFGNSIAVINMPPKGELPQDGGGVVSTFHSGELNQKIGYVEVPVEVSYKVLNRRFGIDVIGGFSSMFLNDNRVSLLSGNNTTEIGRANNLNKVHISSNVGLGFRYSFLKSFEANFEPMFKYQFNTFSSESGNFKPYFVGLYTGISYRF